jgi:hypothetical protein
VARPDHTILWAVSLGTVVAFDSIEHFKGIYDGALCLCAVGAGATRTFDSAADLALAYDVVFGMPTAWGTPGDVRNDIDFETEVFPKLLAEVGNPLNFPKFEFLRLVLGTPGRGITPPPPPAFYPGWLFTDMFYVTEARAELERRAGGHFVQNENHTYTLSPQERAYLNALGLPNAVLDALLAQMNARTNIKAEPAPRNYVEHYADYTGRIKRPVLTMHTIIDPLIVVTQESAYAETVASAKGHHAPLFQTYTNGNGHCAFTGPQMLTAVAAINNWIVNGTAPTAATFPAALGFVPNFVPPPFPQP